MGFEPTAHCCVTGFQDQLLKPLGHLSEYPMIILYQAILVNGKFVCTSPFLDVGADIIRPLLFPLSHKIRGVLPGLLHERLIKSRVRTKTAIHSHPTGGDILCQQSLGQYDTLDQYIIVYGGLGVGLKQPLQMHLADVKMVGDMFQRDLFGEMSIDVPDDLLMKLRMRLIFWQGRGVSLKLQQQESAQAVPLQQTGRGVVQLKQPSQDITQLAVLLSVPAQAHGHFLLIGGFVQTGSQAVKVISGQGQHHPVAGLFFFVHRHSVQGIRGNKQQIAYLQGIGGVLKMVTDVSADEIVDLIHIVSEEILLLKMFPGALSEEKMPVIARRVSGSFYRNTLPNVEFRSHRIPADGAGGIRDTLT